MSANIDVTKYTNTLQVIASILKKRFPNLSVEETIKIAGEILIALAEND